MNWLGPAGIVGVGAVIATALASGGSQNVTETPVIVKTVTEQHKTQPKPSVASTTPKNVPISVKSESIPKNTPVVSRVIQETLKKPETTSNCHPSYSGCLKMNAGDYDCTSGSGNGPNYTGPVEVHGSDPYDLDRDNDGVGCD